MMKYKRFTNQDVKSTFENYPKKIRDRLLFLRNLIFQIAEENSDVGGIEETLKWESPSYLTHKPKSGTTVRLSQMTACDNKYAISVHCQTSLISEFKTLYADLDYDANRSIVFDINDELPVEVAQHFIYLALTYHYRKKQGVRI